MKFARIWFTIAGWWGIVTLLPLFFMFNLIGHSNPPMINHPEYYYGFLSVALAWQIAFLIIAREPVTYRALMIPATLEKLGYATVCVVLFAQQRTLLSGFLFGLTDLALGIGFVVAYSKTSDKSLARTSVR